MLCPEKGWASTGLYLSGFQSRYVEGIDVMLSWIATPRPNPVIERMIIMMMMNSKLS